MKLAQKYNLPLLVIPVLLFSLGFLTLLSTSPERAKDQLLFFIISYALFILVTSLDIEIFRSLWKYLYVSTLLLLAVTLVIGEVIYGSARWIDFGFFNLQPSEFAKISLILVLSSLIVRDKNSIKSIKSIIRIILLAVPLFILVFIQPDLGTTLILVSVLLGTLYYAGLNRWFFILGVMLVGIFSTPLWELLRDYQKERILVFLNPSLDVLGSGYNVIQALIAVGSGGWAGKGFGHGTQSQLRFLPAHWTDFAFASFAEEWGFIGIILMLVLFVLLFISIIGVSLKASTTYGSLVVIGVFIVFFGQFIINIGMNLGVMPVTGIPLPLVSYGGSSLLTSMLLLGLVQSVWAGRKV